MGVIEVFIFLNVLVMIYDLCYMTIPNEINACLLVTAFISLYTGDVHMIPLTTALQFFGTLFVGFILFYFGLIGGGDVKFLTVSTLWVGPEGYVSLLVFTSIFGGVISLMYLISKGFYMQILESAIRNIWEKIAFKGWIPVAHDLKDLSDENDEGANNIAAKQKKMIPYGIAISCASIITVLFKISL
jgi:Flp pilus assembly protein protease CpaA